MPSRPIACKCGGIRRNGRCDRCGKYEGRGSSAQRLYGSDWRKARRLYLADNPLCVQCAKDGKTVEARAVDHIIPHRGDLRLFWDRSNWQGLCIKCHNAKAGRGE